MQDFSIELWHAAEKVESDQVRESARREWDG